MTEFALVGADVEHQAVAVEHRQERVLAMLIGQKIFTNIFQMP
jgi:hypothetical protein